MRLLNTIKHLGILAVGCLVLAITNLALAQEGHPLEGTWSGDRLSGGDKVRVLLILHLQPDQSFDATLIENGARIPLSKVTLHPEDWTVSLEARGKNRAGETVHYEIEGTLENLGSATERMIAGTWTDANGSGDFRVRMN